MRYHAAIRGGHRAAQVSLVDKIMGRSYTTATKEEEEENLKR